ncbi:MAG: cell division protein FtsW, partial [Chromatiales bacterium]
MNATTRRQASSGRSMRDNELFPLDYWLLGAALALLCFGLLMVASASMTVSDRLTGSPFFY